MIFSFLIVPNRLNGQNCDCSVYPSYKCIVSGTLPDLIASGDLLDYTEAQTEPQFIVVESDINFYDPNDMQPYRFAPGSAIFMLAGSGLAIRKEVVFSGTSLFGCTERWNGITVFNGGTLRMVEGSNIANTCLAIELKPYSKAEIVSTTFANNRVCIEATGEVQTIGAGIAHNTFDRGAFQFNCSATLERGIILRNVPHTNPGFSYRGIQLRESPRCFLSCNQSQSLNEGIAFHGLACDKTNFLQNIMSDNLTGLYLAPGTIIGRQKDRENKWYGDLPAGGVAEANFDGMPGLGLLQLSLFQINSSNPGSSFWATPRIPAGGWFDFSDNEVGLLYTCLQEAEPYPPKSEAEGMLIGGGFENYKGYPASGWELALSAFGTLDEHPELRPENSPEASFYNTHLSGNVGKLSRARASWDIITRFSASLEANWATNAAETDQKLEEIQAENLAMEQAGTAAEQAQIVETLEGLKTELETLLQTNQSLSAQYESDIADRANDLATDLATINASEVWESNLKTVLELSVAKLISGNGEWTSSQFTSLESIANQCRYEGGIGVVMARSAIDKFDFDDEAMCPGWVDERTNQSMVLNAKISPNPANTQCRLFFEQAVNGTLYVRNMQGQTVQSLTLSERSALILNTEKWPAGLYTVSVFADSGARFSAKVAISH